MSEVTQLIQRALAGNENVSEQILPLVYDELRELAAMRLRQEKPGHTLTATSLVHEAYVRLVDVEQPQSWDDRGHFFAAAAEAMRRILVEHARRKMSEKHGGQLQRVDLDLAGVSFDSPPDRLLALNEAIDALTESDKEASEIAKTRLFAGLTLDEIAESREMSRTSVHRQWKYARAWLMRFMNGDAEQNL